MKSIIERVQEERRRQDEKWGVQNHNPVEWIAILSEEVGEASREAVDFYFANGTEDAHEKADYGTQWQRIERLKRELIQTAAVAIAAAESIERQVLA